MTWDSFVSLASFCLSFTRATWQADRRGVLWAEEEQRSVSVLLFPGLPWGAGNKALCLVNGAAGPACGLHLQTQGGGTFQPGTQGFVGGGGVSGASLGAWKVTTCAISFSFPEISQPSILPPFPRSVLSHSRLSSLALLTWGKSWKTPRNRGNSDPWW